MKVLLTGGTGFVGQEVARQLTEAGHSIRLLVRGAKAPPPGLNAELCPGDVLNPASLLAAAKGAQAVIHLVGIISEVGGTTFENLHTRATGNVLEAARQAGVRRFVHMSALGTRPDAASRYHQTKWAAEELVRHSGLDYTIFRPSLIFGPQDHFVNMLARMARFSPVLPVTGNPRARFQPVAVETVAAAFVRALSTPATLGMTLDLCGPETLTFPRILKIILETTHRRRLLLQVPAPLAQLQAAILEAVYPVLLRKAPPLNRDQLIMLQEDNGGDGSEANSLLGLPLVSFRQGISSYLR